MDIDFATLYNFGAIGIVLIWFMTSSTKQQEQTNSLIMELKNSVDKLSTLIDNTREK